jgi:CheY-like chemotaxis protein
MGSKLEKPRALLVDDDEPDRHHNRDIFLREGFTVDEAVNGREALDRIRENSYDIIVLDILMPYVDGYEVMRHLKMQRPDVLNRTVVVSRLNLKDMQVFFPGCRLIQKPASREDLMRAAREYRMKQ